MTRKPALIAALAIGAGAVLIPAGVASASIPIMQHSAAGGLTNAKCIDGTAWSVTLGITGTDLDKHPVATVTYTGNQMQGITVPYSHVFTTQAHTFTASAHIVWDDGFTADVGPWSATKPEGCIPPTTVPDSTPPTTTCQQAIPPRTDCGGTTTAPPTTVPETTTIPPTTMPATTPTTACAHPVTLEDGSVVCNDTYHAPPATPPTNPPAAHQEAIPNQLPTTGAGVGMRVAIALGVFLILCGVIIVVWVKGEERRLARMHQQVMADQDTNR